MDARILAAFLVGALVSALDAQAPTPGQQIPAQPQTPRATPARDRPGTGTAALKGYVISAETGKPIRRARVYVSGPTISTAVLTNSDGQFEIAALSAGKYVVSATKPGYVSNVRPDTRPDPIELADAQKLEKIAIALSRGGVISGQVLDEGGDPLTGADFRALRFRYVDGERRLTSSYNGAPQVFTDDLGTFRLFGLEPGDYYVAASGGRDYMSFGGTASIAEGPAQTFYPGTSNASDARRITVRAARETTSVIFPIVLARLARVKGRVQGASGEPFAGMISVAMRDRMTANMASSGAVILPDGTFQVANLPPGTYALTARPSFGPNGARQTNVMAQTMVSVDGEDVNDVVMFAAEGGIARGRTVTDEGIPPVIPLNSVQIFAQPVDPMTPFVGGQNPPVKPDGTFEVTGLWGAVHLRSSGVGGREGDSGPPWTFKSVLLDGRDVTDSGIDFQPGRVVDNIDIVFTRKVSRISGEVLDDSGKVPPAAWVVLLPADERKWVARSRYVRGMRADAKGTYRLSAVPYDDYVIVGVTGLEDGQWADRDFLQAVRDLGTRISIGEGETKVQNIKIVDWRR
jgi:hypothetical protein